jgi:type IV secretory pathway VirB2 component (pilin)
MQPPPKKFFLSLLAVSLLAAVPASAVAQIMPVNTKDFVGTSTTLVDSIVNIINALLVLAAVAAVLFIIISGVRYMAAQGDERELDQAKRSLIYGIVVIIIILLAAVIVNYFAAAVGRGGRSGSGAPTNFAPQAGGALGQ